MTFEFDHRCPVCGVPTTAPFCHFCRDSAARTLYEHKATMRVRDRGQWEGCSVRFKLLHPSATVPKYAHDGDSGMDLAALEAWTLAPHSRCKIQLGIAIGLPAGYEAQIRPRSSLSAKGIVCAFGTIDQGYTGELAAVLYNLTDDVVTIDAGQRICQLVIAPVARAEMVQVDTLDETSRGDGGFGSTDKVKP